MNFGIDVSHNNGNIDWEKVKDEVDFAMIRAGYGRYQEDACFEENTKACEELGIPYGIYWFSYATSVENARIEAEKCLQVLQGKKVTYPVAYDFEEISMDYVNAKGLQLDATETSAMANAFLEIIEEAGYTGILYSDLDNVTEYFPQVTSYPIWLAKWGDAPSGDYPMWQYSATGSIDGIEGDVDLNYSYREWGETVDWEEILQEKTDQADLWIAGVNAVVDIAKQKHDIGDLQIMEYLPEMIEKIAKN